MVALSIRFIWLYRRIAPADLRAQCRYSPSCSEYALQALERYGFFQGWGLALQRIWRCRPPFGGYDPVK